MPQENPYVWGIVENSLAENVNYLCLSFFYVTFGGFGLILSYILKDRSRLTSRWCRIRQLVAACLGLVSHQADRWRLAGATQIKDNNKSRRTSSDERDRDKQILSSRQKDCGGGVGRMRKRRGDRLQTSQEVGLAASKSNSSANKTCWHFSFSLSTSVAFSVSHSMCIIKKAFWTPARRGSTTFGFILCHSMRRRIRIRRRLRLRNANANAADGAKFVAF